MIITAWRCVNPEKFPCEAPGGCGGAFCWKALGFTEAPPLPFDPTSKPPVDRTSEE